MRIKVLAFLLLLLLANGLKAQFSYDPKVKAKEAVYLFKNNKFEGMLMRMNPEMNRYLDKQKLGELKDALEMQYGPLQSTGEPDLVYADTLAITLTPLSFEKRRMGLKLVYEKTGLICGMFVTGPSFSYSPPAYVDASQFYELKKDLPNSQFPSPAVVTLPNKGEKFPLIIIVGGSGPTDKDLTIGPNKIYADIAWGLAQKGVAVLRYDKRTRAFPQKMAAIKNPTVEDEYLGDLKSAISLAKQFPQIDSNRIYVLGHSQGAYLIPYFESKIKGIAGYISFAGPYHNMATMMIYQCEYLMRHSQNEKEKIALDKLRTKSMYARDHLRVNTPSDSLPDGLNATYLMHMNANSPANLMEQISTKPILLLQGGRDYQVPTDEFKLWHGALYNNPNMKYKVFDALNHLGLEGKGISLPAEYENPGNVPAYFIDEVVNFLVK